MRFLRFVKEFFQSKHIQLALVSGLSILVLAFVSKRVLAEPMDNIYISIPALLVVAGEGALGTKKKAWYTNPGLWIISVVLATTLIIVFHMI